MPMYLLWGVLKVTCFTGKTLAILLILSISLFTFIGKTSMLVLLINAFLAIKFDLRYYTWKRNDKAIAIVAVEWLSCVVLSSLFCLHVCLVSLLQYVFRREDANLAFALLTFRMLVFLHPCVNTFVVYSTKRC